VGIFSILLGTPLADAKAAATLPGARDSRGSNCRTQFLHLNIKLDFIKQNYTTFYLWDPMDEKSEQDY
jgi:hypothetical protein